MSSGARLSGLSPSPTPDMIPSVQSAHASVFFKKIRHFDLTGVLVLLLEQNEVKQMRTLGPGFGTPELLHGISVFAFQIFFFSFYIRDVQPVTPNRFHCQI